MSDSTEPVVAPPGDKSSARTMWLTMLVLILSAFAVIWSLGQVWASRVYNDSITNQTEVITGSSLYPIAVVGAWVALASVLAVFATSGRARWILGAVILLCGAAVVTAPFAFILTDDTLIFTNSLPTVGAVAVNKYWIVTAICGVLIVICGVFTLLRGSTWRGLSARQSRTDTPQNPPTTPWEALDRGEDPTLPT